MNLVMRGCNSGGRVAVIGFEGVFTRLKFSHVEKTGLLTESSSSL